MDVAANVPLHAIIQTMRRTNVRKRGPRKNKSDFGWTQFVVARHFCDRIVSAVLNSNHVCAFVGLIQLYAFWYFVNTNSI